MLDIWRKPGPLTLRRNGRLSKIAVLSGNSAAAGAARAVAPWHLLLLRAGLMHKARLASNSRARFIKTITTLIKNISGFESAT